MPVSSTERASTPTLSSDQQSAITPVRGVRPKVGRNPVVPQRCEGETTEPIVSVPMPKPIRPAAVPEAEPALEPEEPSSGLNGLRDMPPCQTSPEASAPTAVLPSNTAPAALRRAATIESFATGPRLANGSAPHVLGAPSASKISFRPYGMPCSGERI